MDYMNKCFPWTSVVLRGPNWPDSPRPVLRRVPAQSRSSSSESTTRSHPNTLLGSPSNSSATCSPNCFSSASASTSASTSSSTSSSSKSKPLLTPNCPVPQWVRILRSMTMVRSRQCGTKGSKRPAEMSDESKELTEETVHLTQQKISTILTCSDGQL